MRLLKMKGYAPYILDCYHSGNFPEKPYRRRTTNALSLSNLTAINKYVSCSYKSQKACMCSKKIGYLMNL